MTWTDRAKDFNKLQWATDPSFLNAIIEMGKFEKGHSVLEVGTATALVAKAIKPFVKQVIGVDTSWAMLKHSEGIPVVCGDIRNLMFRNNQFDRVVARQVFHHIVDGIEDGMRECHRVLKVGGLMIIAESVPPCLEVKEDFIRIFKFKEKRLTFMEEDLIDLMRQAGFQDMQVAISWIRQMSVKNWLGNSGLAQEVQEKMFNLFLKAEEITRNVFNMIYTDQDCLLDIKMAIISGRKK